MCDRRCRWRHHPVGLFGESVARPWRFLSSGADQQFLPFTITSVGAAAAGPLRRKKAAGVSAIGSLGSIKQLISIDDVKGLSNNQYA